MSSPEPYPINEQPLKAWCDAARLHVELRDGRELVTPLWWYPRLLAATPEERENVELMLDGVHWPDIDEDLSVRGMLRGWKYPSAVEPPLAAE
ncbi:DUF2442 domain-containing protein [Mesorhizobium sp. RP14(2022)]|uniref:DUF2442 domain-containing protein n=1 Tax=Mesorhizobium liriopis TaxID=2953882 RepID=A0ABT1C3L4_9HYPH|nr:DUF2442 domain-containing protein [Mesorhizobium liriopis]MCO6049427.1 DUF2442 domain-containing protein [Mesorhizobium liriopis]